MTWVAWHSVTACWCCACFCLLATDETRAHSTDKRLFAKGPRRLFLVHLRSSCPLDLLRHQHYQTRDCPPIGPQERSDFCQKRDTRSPFSVTPHKRPIHALYTLRHTPPIARSARSFALSRPSSPAPTVVDIGQSWVRRSRNPSSKRCVHCPDCISPVRCGVSMPAHAFRATAGSADCMRG